MIRNAALIAIALALASCGGGGSTTNALVTKPAGNSITYSGSFFDAQGVNRGSATVVVSGNHLQATCVPTSSLKSTFLIVGTVQNSQIISTETPPSPIGTETVVGTTLTISDYDDTLDHYGVLSLVATQNAN